MDPDGTEKLQPPEDHVDTPPKSKERENRDESRDTNNDSKGEEETQSSPESKGSTDKSDSAPSPSEEDSNDTPPKSEEPENRDESRDTNNDSEKDEETESSPESKGEDHVDTPLTSEEPENRDESRDTNNDSKEDEETGSSPESKAVPECPEELEETANTKELDSALLEKTFTHAGLKEGSSYEFRVAAVNQAGQQGSFSIDTKPVQCEDELVVPECPEEPEETAIANESFRVAAVNQQGSFSIATKPVQCEDELEDDSVDAPPKGEEHGNRDEARDKNNDSKEDEETESSHESKGNKKGWLLACFIVLVAVSLNALRIHLASPPEQKEVRRVDVFLKELEMIQSKFPTQHDELWRRGRIHLKRHLEMEQPSEPVSLILTAGRKAEKTLHCLARGLASAFSSALNASVLHIDGASKAHLDSDQVKLDIDSQLRGAFEGDRPVAVIHRFEELPPGSTLIFYRYCDHENAAYKKTSLIFTVLLAGEEELPTKLSLSAVEEMVDDHLKKKFLSAGHPITFDRMDLDKYSGLWSRISHLILPVASEETMEPEGCQET